MVWRDHNTTKETVNSMKARVKKLFFSKKSRLQRIDYLVSFCIKRALTPKSNAWFRKIEREGIFRFHCCGKTVKSYVREMKISWDRDRWASYVINSDYLTNEEKEVWFKSNAFPDTSNLAIQQRKREYDRAVREAIRRELARPLSPHEGYSNLRHIREGVGSTNKSEADRQHAAGIL